MIQNSPKPPESIPTGSIQWDSSWPVSIGPAERETLLAFLEERFGIARSVFDAYLLLARKQSWILIRRTDHLEQASRLRVSGVGLKAFQRVSRYLKPTTRLIQCFGRFATRGKVEVEDEDLLRLIRGEALSPSLDLSPGYVILTLPGERVVGLGFWAQGKLRSQLPHKGLSAAMLGGAERKNNSFPEERYVDSSAA